MISTLLKTEGGQITFVANTRTTIYHDLGTQVYGVFFEGVGTDADTNPAVTDPPVIVGKYTTYFVCKCACAKTFNWRAFAI